MIERQLLEDSLGKNPGGDEGLEPVEDGSKKKKSSFPKQNSFSWCDLTNPLGNPFCPFPLPWFIFFNFLVKTLVPSLIAPVFETFAEEFMAGQQSPVAVAPTSPPG